jgi:hypothetical protein
MSTRLVEAGSGTGLYGTGFRLMSGVLITVCGFVNLDVVVSPDALSVVVTSGVGGRKRGVTSAREAAAASAAARCCRYVSVGVVVLTGTRGTLTTAGAGSTTTGAAAASARCSRDVSVGVVALNTVGGATTSSGASTTAAASSASARCCRYVSFGVVALATGVDTSGVTAAWPVVSSADCERSTSPDALVMKVNTEAINAVKASCFTVYSPRIRFATQPNYNRESVFLEGDSDCNGYQSTEKAHC